MIVSVQFRNFCTRKNLKMKYVKIQFYVGLQYMFLCPWDWYYFEKKYSSSNCSL
jgi:hypothetical protein